MTTLKITVNNRKNALLLTKLLKSMAFVKKVEEDYAEPNATNQFSLLNDFLNTLPKDSILNAIRNPVEWQKRQRDEWETR